MRAYAIGWTVSRHLQGNGGDYALVDGGIFVNNPAMAAYAEARCVYPGESDFYVVSVVTGDRDARITYGQAVSQAERSDHPTRLCDVETRPRIESSRRWKMIRKTMQERKP